MPFGQAMFRTKGLPRQLPIAENLSGLARASLEFASVLQQIVFNAYHDIHGCLSGLTHGPRESQNLHPRSAFECFGAFFFFAF